MAKLNCKRIESLPTDGKEGLGGRGEEKIFFRKDVIAVMVKARGSKRGNAILCEQSLGAMKMIGA